MLKKWYYTLVLLSRLLFLFKVGELEGTIDELEDKLYAEKLKIKQTVEDMDSTIHASAL